MKQFFKYFNSFAFLFLAVFLLGTVKVNAADLQYGNFYYQLDASGNATITGYEEGAAVDLVIPSDIEDHPVTAIGDKAFKNRKNITGSLTIPSSIESIGEYAFYYCSGFTGNLTIPTGVTNIGAYAFTGCTGLTGNLTIPDNVTSIGMFAFSNCTGFDGSLYISKKITVIPEYAFNYCTNLTGTLTIPEGVASIGAYAFNHCQKLSGGLTFPDTVDSIGDRAFYLCKGLNGTLVFPTSMTYIGEYAFFKCSKLNGDLILPNGITTVRDSTFYECDGFTGKLYIPEGVTTIEAEAFAYVKCCGTLTIPESVTSIGAQAFMYCKSFSGNLIIPKTVTTIGNNAFFMNDSLNGYLRIYDSTVGNTAFKYCDKLSFICLSEGCTYQTDSFEEATSDIYVGEYVISFDKNNSDASGNMTSVPSSSKKYTLPSCGYTAPLGNTFAGWSYTADGSDIISGSNITLTDDITLYAVWGIPHTFYFTDTEGATGTAPDPLTGCEGCTVTLPKNTFTKDNYKFIGWSDGTKTYKEGTKYTVGTTNVTFTAQWSKIYTVSFKGGTGATGSAPSKIKGIKGDKITLPKNTFTKKGYEFTGWNDGSKTYKAGASYTISSKNVTFTAKWKKKDLTRRELIEAFAERMYTKALGRSAEPDGLKYWADRLEAKVDDGANMAYGFITSPEFKARNLSKDDFIETMYRTFFDRPSDEGGKTYWMNKMNAGATEEMVLAGFIKSDEFERLCTNAGIERGLILEDGTPVNAGIYQFVKRQYTCCLQRDGERDGMDYWAKRIATKEVTAVDMAKDFFFSAEFEAKGLNDKQYVERLYETFLGRPFDEEGYAYWNNKMAGGETRKEVLDEFAASEEFQGILRSYGL